MSKTGLAVIAGVVFCGGMFGQAPPAPLRPGAPGGTGGAGTSPIEPVMLDFGQALARARVYTGQVYGAEIAAQLAHEDRVQARAALLPSVNWFNQFIYTQPNGRPSGVFVSNDGPHIYNNQAVVHGEVFAPARRADYRRAIAAEAVARARAEIAIRGLVATVAQNYYGLVSAQRKTGNARQSLREAEQFVDITRKQEQGGEAAHADVVKSEILLEQRRRDVEDAQAALEKARIGFGVLLFADYGQAYGVVDDLEKGPVLPPLDEVRSLAAKNNPDLRAAEATVEQQTHETTAARAALLPSLSFDYFYGINSNQYAVHDREHFRNLGSVAQATLTIPVWTWGAARSRIRQSELKLGQARRDLTLAQRTLLAELNSFYVEADTAGLQVASLRHSMDLSAESLKLTVARYGAGEATVLEVVDAQTTLAQARNAYDDGLLRYRAAMANLQTLTGAF
jgi:outer membrane protein TolC